VRQAVSAPHAINKFGTYNLEKNTTMINIKKPLEKIGYKVELSKFFSGLNIIKIKGNISGASDPRREGVAIGG
jgi:gamma-glutamyltranspeptidase/glutathione hydrolase